MAWSYRQSGQQPEQTDGGAQGSGPVVAQPRGNAAIAERFAEQDYGILSASATQRAVTWNNERAAGALDDVLQALGLGSREEYDAEVVGEVAEYQQNLTRTQGLSVDGMVGSGTLASLQATTQVDEGEVDASVLWPPEGASVEQQFEHFSQLAALFGSTPSRGEPLLIGLRGVMQNAGATHNGGNIRAYDDTYVLLLETDEGVGVRTFSGATQAYQAASGASPDADGRGRGDVGSIRPTHEGEHYTLSTRGNYHGRRSLAVNSDPTQWGAQEPRGWNPGHVPMHRDTSHNGQISEAERRASEQRQPGGGREQVLDGMGDFGTVVWFHPGYTEHKASGAAFSSIGCLTARREDVDNLHAVARDQGDIRLIVVDAAEAVQRMQAAGGLATAEGGQ